MRLGVVLPQGAGMRDPIAARDFAQGVEALGYDHLIAFDHVVGADPENRPAGWRSFFNHKSFVHEPLILFAYLGALTQRLEFCSSIIIMPQRQTVLFAKQAAEVDYLTGGRLRLGLGLGWNTVEFESLNENFGNRGRRIAEQVEVMRALWTQEVVDFKGKWHRIDRAGVNPLPVQRPVPIWMGGYAEPVLRRAAATADGWLPLTKGTDDGLKKMLGDLRGYVGEAGRQEAAFGVEGRINLADSGPEDWRRELIAWRELEATHVGVATGANLASPEAHLAVLRQFKDVAG